jgi:hypothetical protein
VLRLQLAQLGSDRLGQQFLDRVALVDVLGLRLLLEDVLEGAQLVFALVLLPYALEVGSDDFLDQHQLLLLQLLHELEVVYHLLSQLPLNFRLHVGLIDELLLFLVKVVFGLEGL